MVASTDKYAALAAFFRSGLAGDSVDYARFLEGVTPLIKRIVIRKLGTSEADDVVQEILISMHKARHTYDGMRPLLPWVAAIARFRITDHLRRHYAGRRHQTIDIADVEFMLADVTDSKGQSESVDALLDGVPAPQRQILTLMHVEGYTAKEVGARMNMSESAVKVAAHRAIKKLRKQYVA